MKIKIDYQNLSILCFLLAFLIFLLLIKVNSGLCEELGPCVLKSRHIKKVQEGFGRKMRFGVGFIHPDDKVAHQWAEWWNEKRQKWCLYDRERSWYTAEETGYKVLYTSNVGHRSSMEMLLEGK